MSEGRFTLHRFNGNEIYRIADAVLWAHPRVAGGVVLWFEVTTEEAALQTLPETAEMEMHPNAEVGVVLPALNINQLAGARFTVPRAYDEAEGERVAMLYYCEHGDLDENEVLTSKRRGAEFLVRWMGTTTDVNYYDGSQRRRPSHGCRPARAAMRRWRELQTLEGEG